MTQSTMADTIVSFDGNHIAPLVRLLSQLMVSQEPMSRKHEQLLTFLKAQLNLDGWVFGQCGQLQPDDSNLSTQLPLSKIIDTLSLTLPLKQSEDISIFALSHEEHVFLISSKVIDSRNYYCALRREQTKGRYSDDEINLFLMMCGQIPWLYYGLKEVHAATIREPVTSPQIIRVINCLIAGNTNTEISNKLNISSNTTKEYVSKSLELFNARNRHELQALSLRGKIECCIFGN